MLIVEEKTSPSVPLDDVAVVLLAQLQRYQETEAEAILKASNEQVN